MARDRRAANDYRGRVFRNEPERGSRLSASAPTMIRMRYGARSTAPSAPRVQAPAPSMIRFNSWCEAAT
jgi:hypothetical protein